jgi:probable rRNA maturation factor
MKFDVIFYNRQRKVTLSSDLKETLTACVGRTLEKENTPFDARVYITFVSDAKIKEYNKEFRDIHKETDVLSFPMISFENGQAMIQKSDFDPDGFLEIGDIVISLERAKSQSEEYGHSFLREVCFLCVHSMLHLLGFDHMDVRSEEEMIKKQEEILYSLGIGR